MELSQRLTDLDRAHIWHPLTQHQTAEPPLPIVKAKGALLYDDKGNSYIDGISSWYTAMYGHSHPEIVSAMKQQLDTLDFVMFSGFTHQPAVMLSEELLALLPGNQKKVFFNDNGSTAIEAAVKMALQYHFNRGSKRTTLIALQDGFHGDTFGAMSVSGISSYNGPFESLLLDVVRIPTPQEDNLPEVRQALQHILDKGDVAAFVFEPLIQGAAGMKFHSAKGLDSLVAQCHAHGVLCIADEIMTGFGKTATLFASEQLKHKPDIICLSKALTAGMFPLSITSCSQAVFDAFLSKDVAKGFFHAHTYSAHPVGCAAALAALRLLRSDVISEQRDFVARSHQDFLEGMQDHGNIRDIRTQGMVLAMDLRVDSQRYGGLRDVLYRFFMSQGINLRPLGNTVYALPPFVIEPQQLERIYQGFRDCLKLVD